MFQTIKLTYTLIRNVQGVLKENEHIPTMIKSVSLYSLPYFQ